MHREVDKVDVQRGTPNLLLSHRNPGEHPRNSNGVDQQTWLLKPNRLLPLLEVEWVLALPGTHKVLDRTDKTHRGRVA